MNYAVEELLIDEDVFGETVEVYPVEFLYLADLEVEGPFGHQQDPEVP